MDAPERLLSDSGPGAERLARRLQRLHPEVSYTRARRAIEEGQVSVAGAVCRDPGAVVDATAAVVWDRNRPRSRGGAPPVTVRHADAEIAVVEKPSGLLTQPTVDKERDTLLSRVSSILERREGRRPYLAVVQRLDKLTSGLIVFVRNRRALASLQEQLLERRVEREYVAVVEGRLADEAGTVARALAGDGTRRKRGVAAAGERGKTAVTHWRVLRRFPDATLVSAQLETGRTHQIRIHFAALGHSVVGDAVYRPADRPPFAYPFPRLALHARRLAFSHPADGRWLTFEMEPPGDFAALLARLEASARARGRRRSA
ncbi:MAG: RluA family pseudouridine synthase [Thermoanaerobaculia bacterium]